MELFDTTESRDFSEDEFAKTNIFESERMFTDVYAFEPGQEQEPHSHEASDKVYYVLEGRGTFVVNDEEREVGEGNVVVAEAGESHGVRNDSDARLRTLVFMAPHPAHVQNRGNNHGHKRPTDTEHDHEHDHSHEHHHSEEAERDFAVLTVSSTRDEAEDSSGSAVIELVEDDGHEVVDYSIVTDDVEEITQTVNSHLESDVEAVVTTGGTGLSPDDVTVEAVRPLLDKEIPGFGEYFRSLSVEEVGTAAVLSRATAGVANGTAVFVLPGSENAARLGTREIVLPEVNHILGLVR